MSIGTGIAVFGAWVFAGFAWSGGKTTGLGMWIALLAAGAVTWGALA